jgi:hypothetical protein
MRLLVLVGLLAGQDCHCLCTLRIVPWFHLIVPWSHWHGNPARQSASGLASHPFHLLLVRLLLRLLVLLGLLAHLLSLASQDCHCCQGRCHSDTCRKDRNQPKAE